MARLQTAMNSSKAAMSCCSSWERNLVAGSPDRKAVQTLKTPLFTCNKADCHKKSELRWRMVGEHDKKSNFISILIENMEELR